MSASIRPSAPRESIRNTVPRPRSAGARVECVYCGNLQKSNSIRNHQLRCSVNPENIQQFELAEVKTNTNFKRGSQHSTKSTINNNEGLSLCHGCTCCSFWHCTCSVQCRRIRWLLLVLCIIVVICIVVAVVIYVKKGKEIYTFTKPTGECIISLTTTTMVIVSTTISAEGTTGLPVGSTISVPILTTTSPSIPSGTTTTTTTEECKSSFK
ncbi:hypothetical protein I4U23_022030 [Adineta vaga]|nr:hypothetical protein I4U23_022030 [Adineta vaga]